MQEKSEKELKRIQFYKELIKHKLDGIRDIIGDLKYRVYLGVVEECNDYNELREIAELDMHIEFVEYVKKHILDKLNEDEVSIDDLREYYYGESMEYSEAEVVFSNIAEADDSFIALMAMALNNRFIHDEEIDEPEEIELDESALGDESEFDVYEDSEEPEQDSEFDIYEDSDEPEQDSEFDDESLYGDEEELEEDSDDVEVDEGNLYGDEIEEPEEADEELKENLEEPDEALEEPEEILEETEEALEEPEEVELELEEADDEPEINEDDFFVDSNELEEDEADNTDVEIDESDFFVDVDEEDDDTEDTSDEPEIDVDEDEFFVDGDDEVDDSEEEDDGINEEDFFVDGDDDIEEDVEEPVDDEIDENDFFVDSDEEEDDEGIDVDTLFGDESSSGGLFIPPVAKKPQSQQGGSTQPKTAAKHANTVFKDPRAQSVLDFMHRGLSGVIGPKRPNLNKGKTR